MFFATMFCVILIPSLKYHSGRGYLNWKSEIYADRAGYYIFLPATFYYQWDPKKAPLKMDEKTGFGFVYDYQNGKIRTKYSCGLAFPIAPFFIATQYIARILGIPREDGFAPVFHRMADVAAAFYLVLGMFLLFRFLRKYFSLAASYLTLIFLLAGTNLLYYSLYDTLMTHVYNFALVAAYLLSYKKYLDGKGKYRFFLIASAALAMLTLIRPTSIVLIIVVFLLDTRTPDELKARIQMLFRLKHLPLMGLFILIGYIPQLLYNRYVSGQFIYYLYDDSFANMLSPRIVEIWFSTMNGLFIYTPMMILVIVGMIIMVRKKAVNAWISIILFLVLSYAFASWTCWYFGCSFGQRSFIDVFPVFAIPFAFLTEQAIAHKKKAMQGFIILIMLLFSWYNISLSYVYEECFFGSAWDWNRYGQLLHKARILPFKPGFSYINDYENQAICGSAEITTLVARSGNHSLLFDHNHEFNGYFVDYQTAMSRDSALTSLHARLWVFKTSAAPTGALLVCETGKDGKTLKWDSRPIDIPMARTREWYAVPVKFDIPKDLDPWAEIKVYVWNKDKSTFYIDDLELKTE